jgi:hypothetical protein
MVGTWGLEPQTSTVSTPEFEVNRCTYKALVATKSPASYGSLSYCGLKVSMPIPYCAFLHTCFHAEGNARFHARDIEPHSGGSRYRFPMRRSQNLSGKQNQQRVREIAETKNSDCEKQIPEGRRELANIDQDEPAAGWWFGFCRTSTSNVGAARMPGAKSRPNLMIVV